MRERDRRELSEPQELRYDAAGMPLGLIVFLVTVIILGVWQFVTLAPKEKDFPSDQVDVAVRGGRVVVYNPTNEIVDVFQVTIQRLSGSYSFTDRNLRPKSSRRISLRKLRKAGGQKYNPSEGGECRLRLEYWRGEDYQDVFRYCRGF
jgi:hypothetical protein